ncbi:hypothetical protein PLIIFM63780_010363 [Purpureocillium lilacinum]|uniref:Microtubule associated protein n=1 Tax=Purpureocillium lilacinum TaxID=33203 RepID=A0A2U3DWB0_PURLI|nr:hypothetical protein Purlil1_12673 [Purpureocillium lilacinum]PWI66539.1 hypothetical protein PCL_04952 [Purpureocillium lilacinum]GJN69977.1 hypothetical protein PLICBS_004029 [Purpureocillium lilacinum]GJN86781.1 hypothetical protein PLIIFM63780_010363 [Purpureocillium lilacinum]
MVVVTRPPANAFVAWARKIYNPMGFAKGYNFVLWFIFGGALVGFALARFMYLNIPGIFCAGGANGASPGECYYYMKGRERVGLILHLAGILPAGLLAVFQFLPVIRHKILIVHRVSGYIIILLSMVGIAGVFMIARHGLGGGLDVQSAAGIASIIFVTCKAIAFYNIKVLQIEQHRAWMLRAWVIAGFIVTMRIIGIIMAKIIGRPGGEYYVARPCYLVDNMFHGNQSRVEDLYPACAAFYSGADPNVHVPIHADMTSGRPDQIASSFNNSFGPAGFLALIIHAIGAEVYLHLTPRESERLRRVSYQRQLEAGMRNPGNAGLTAQKVGDAEPWFPNEPRVDEMSSSSVEDKPASA